MLLIVIFLDDYSIGCLSPASSAFLGLHRNNEFGSQIYSWRESLSGQRTESSYGRALDYSNLGLSRFLKNPNRITDPQTAGFQQVLHSGQEGAEGEGRCSIGRTTYGAWNVSKKTRKWKRSILASSSSRSLESYLSSLLFFIDRPRERTEELSLNSGSIYGALGGIRSTSNGPFKIQYGPLTFRVEQDGSPAFAIDDSKLRSGSGQSLKNIRRQVLATLPCGHWVHRVCLVIRFLQISLAAT